MFRCRWEKRSQNLRSLLYENALAGRTRDGQSDSDKLWLAQQKVITDLAKEGPCVIVGRCADFILRNIADCLTVFIHASEEKRAERIVSVYGERDEKPMQRIRDKDKDKKRKAYYEIYTGTEWGKADNYDLCLDSGVLGMEMCADDQRAVLTFLQKRDKIER